MRAEERAKTQHSVPYFDFTISAAKSVSVLHASLLVSARQARERGAHERATRLEAEARAIADALLDAARAAVTRAEQNLYIRTGYHGGGHGEYRDARGATAALFLQHTSREGDPQLHVHCAVMNLAQRADEADSKWRTLHGAMLYQARLDVAAEADRQLATRLTDLGYHLVLRPDRNGFEIGGVPQPTMDHFSSRRVQQVTPEVERMAGEYRQRYGREPSQRTRWQMAQTATLSTRKAKQHNGGDRSGRPQRTAGAELDEWEASTTEQEIEQLSHVHEQVRDFVPPEADGPAPAELNAEQQAGIIAAAIGAAQQNAAVFTRAAVRYEVHRHTPAMARGVDQAAVVDGLTDAALASGQVLNLGPAPDVADVAQLGVRVSDGRSIFTPPGADRYTTAAHLDLEEHLVAEAAREVSQLVPPREAAAAVAGRGLDPAQAEVARGLLSTRTFVSTLIAPAGAGKSRTMAATAQGWTAVTGGRVIGVTLSTNAARVLAGEGLTSAVNIAQFLGRLEDGGSRGAMRAGPRDIIVIDEASQVGTRDLAAILEVAKAGGARVFLTGDPAQLGAIEAGGMMRLIGADLGHYELAEVRRFGAAWEADASLQLRQGDRAAIAAYDTRGRIRGAPEPEAERSAVSAYLADYLIGRDTILLAGTNEEAAKLAGMARNELVRLGQVPARPVVSLADGNGAAAGDLIRARENTRKLDAAGRALTNRDVLRLEGVTLAAGGKVAMVRRQLADRSWSREFPVPLDYLRRSAELGYAGNVWVSQGRTTDTAHLHVSPTLTRESQYVGMSRGREANTMHVVTGPAQIPGQKPAAQADPAAVVAEIMDRTAGAVTATEVLRDGVAFATSSGRLLALYSASARPEAYRAIDEAVQERLTPGQFQRYLGEKQRPVFQREAYAATLAGASLDEVVDVAAGRDFTGARSVAAVMHGRLDTAGLTVPGRAAPVTWAQRVPEVIRPQAGHLSVELAGAIDSRGRELAAALAERPEPWVLATLGAFPVDGSPRLQEDWLARIGVAAGYREAEGITDPDAVLGAAPGDNPERMAWYASAGRVLEIRDPQDTIRVMPREELQAEVHAYARVHAAAPRDVSGELRAVRLAQDAARVRQAEAEASGDQAAAADAAAWVMRYTAQGDQLEAEHAEATVWEAETAGQRQRAEWAQEELNRPGPETAKPEPEAAADEAGPQEEPAPEPDGEAGPKPAETETGQPEAEPRAETEPAEGGIPDTASDAAGAEQPARAGQPEAAEPGVPETEAVADDDLSEPEPEPEQETAPDAGGTGETQTGAPQSASAGPEAAGDLAETPEPEAEPEVTASEAAMDAAAAEPVGANVSEPGLDAEADLEPLDVTASGPELPEAEPVSLLEQYQQDAANLAALEAKLNAERAAREAEAAAEPEQADPEPETAETEPAPGPMVAQIRQDMATIARLEAELEAQRAAREAAAVEPGEAKPAGAEASLDDADGQAALADTEPEITPAAKPEVTAYMAEIQADSVNLPGLTSENTAPDQTGPESAEVTAEPGPVLEAETEPAGPDEVPKPDLAEVWAAGPEPEPEPVAEAEQDETAEPAQETARTLAEKPPEPEPEAEQVQADVADETEEPDAEPVLAAAEAEPQAPEPEPVSEPELEQPVAEEPEPEPGPEPEPMLADVPLPREEELDARQAEWEAVEATDWDAEPEPGVTAEPEPAPPRPEFEEQIARIDDGAETRREAEADAAAHREAAQRAAVRAPELEAETPEVWMDGPATPAWGGPNAGRDAPGAEAYLDLEAGL